jgi:hypothetical protein
VRPDAPCHPFACPARALRGRCGGHLPWRAGRVRLNPRGCCGCLPCRSPGRRQSRKSRVVGAYQARRAGPVRHALPARPGPVAGGEAWLGNVLPEPSRGAVDQTVPPIVAAADRRVGGRVVDCLLEVVGGRG